MSQLTKEKLESLIRGAFPAITSRSLQVLSNGYFHKGTIWHAIHQHQVTLNYWGWSKFEALVETIKRLEGENNDSNPSSLHVE